jgi:hypothetical protein
MRAGELIADIGGGFHPVQRHVQQQGSDHPPPGSSLHSRTETTVLDHTRLQPLPDRAGNVLRLIPDATATAVLPPRPNISPPPTPPPPDAEPRSYGPTPFRRGARAPQRHLHTNNLLRAH